MWGHNEYSSTLGRAVYPSYSENGMNMTTRAPETVEVEKAEVRCDGGSNGISRDSFGGRDPLGHPTVFLNMGTKGWVECPYCDRKFVLKDGAPAPVH